MATVSYDADEIRRQMAMIRRDLHNDVVGVVENAATATDWRRYITAYPWVSLGLASMVGYMLVPRRHRTAEAIAATQADLSKVREAVESNGVRMVDAAPAQPPPPARGKSIAAAVLGMVTPLVVRAAQGYALSYLEQWLQAQQSEGHPGGPAPASPPPDPNDLRRERPSGPRHASGPGRFD